MLIKDSDERTKTIVSHKQLRRPIEEGMNLQEVTDLAPQFSVSMTESGNSREDTFSYIVMATAEGGFTRNVSGSMTVAKVCLAELRNDFKPEYIFDLPQSGFVNELFPVSSMDYISKPLAAVLDDNSDLLPNGYSCQQYFTYRIKGNSVYSDNPD